MSRSTINAGWALAAGTVLILLEGCDPSCLRVCKKLLSCEGVENWRVNEEECEESCKAEKALYEDWDNPDLQEALREQNQCILHSSCDEIAAGECYDPDLYRYKDSGY